MGHISVYRRMLVWGIGTIIAIVGAFRIAQVMFAPPILGYSLNISDLLLFAGGWGIIIISETIFSLRKEQLEIDRDETIKSTGEKHLQSSIILAICPKCKSQIPSDAKYCLECGTDLQRQTP